MIHYQSYTRYYQQANLKSNKGVILIGFNKLSVIHPQFREWRSGFPSAATILLENGFSMKEVSEWLGHCDINTTMNIYAHVNYVAKEAMAEKLSTMMLEDASVRTPLELAVK